MKEAELKSKDKHPFPLSNRSDNPAQPDGEKIGIAWDAVRCLDGIPGGLHSPPSRRVR